MAQARRVIWPSVKAAAEKLQDQAQTQEIYETLQSLVELEYWRGYKGR